jgi:Ser/Thr protein kinase RdoA (MazF antagonist)
MTTTDTPQALRFYTVEEAAEVARRTPKAMRQLRARGQGPTFRKIDGRLLVAAADLQAWLTGGGDQQDAST